ncbi:MAG: DNA recombination protein RmuC [Clostridia bacterium]|jgi:DNA recombination protein RmuC|nr:DNA recombination protein RmuC [Clostridia bacterium]
MVEILLGLNVCLLIVVIVYLYKNRVDEKISSEFEKINEKYKDESAKSKEEIQNMMNVYTDFQKKQMEIFSDNFQKQMDSIRKTLEDRIKDLNEENSKKLDEMRMVVDEKLHESLEKRLGEAFKQVSDRLERVHQGLGEMQKLATGVGDLKKVLNNVKTRGSFGEIQLEAQLEEGLSPNQYEKNVKTKSDSDAIVEFAIKLPGNSSDEKPIWIPLDSKFPMDKYEQLLDAYEEGEKVNIQKKQKELEQSIKIFAKDIATKYIDPPNTTDFAIMYLPFEGLYAEVIRIPGMIDTLQKDYKILPVGPTNLMALLNSLRLGFKTLAIEKYSSEVWKLLGAVKTQFGKFGDLLDKTQKKLNEASKTIEDASKKSRYIQGRLNKVDSVELDESINIIGDVIPEEE